MRTVAKAADLIDARLTRLEAAFERFEEMLGECEALLRGTTRPPLVLVQDQSASAISF